MRVGTKVGHGLATCHNSLDTWEILYADWLVRLFELLAFEALMGPCTTCLFEAILTFSLLLPGLKIMLVHGCENVAGKFRQEW